METKTMETKTMKTKTLEEKVRTVILEDIKILADDAWRNPVDYNINKLFASVEYLKKTLNNDIAVSPRTKWMESQPLLKGSNWYDNPVTVNDMLTSR